MHMYITESLCCTSETNNTINQLYASQFFLNKKTVTTIPMLIWSYSLEN